MSAARGRIWIEVLIVCGVAALALVLVAHPSWVRLPGSAGTWVAAVFLYTPLIAVLISRQGFSPLGLCRPSVSKLGLDLVLFSAIILPLFLVSWWALFKYGFKVTYHFRWPADKWSFVLWHFLGVALSEEVFFRGWLQGRLNQLLGRTWKVAGATIGPALFLSALAFALFHYLVIPTPSRLLVFFPALLFGYFREREGSVLGPILAHGLANIFFLALQGGGNF